MADRQGIPRRLRPSAPWNRSVGTQGGLSARALGVLLGAIVATSGTIGVSGFVGGEPVDAATVLYVAPWGVDGAPGTSDRPVKTVGHAVGRARTGDAVVLREGVYRDNVEVTGKALAISAAPGEEVVFDGSVVLDGWQRSDEDWFVDGWERQFPAERGAPVTSVNPVAGHPDQVFFDDLPLDQVLLRSEVEPGTFFHDTARDRIYIGDDPRSARVEASNLGWAFYFRDADGSRLTGVTVRRYGTSVRQLAAIRVHSDDVVVSGVTSELNAAAGLSAIGDRIVITGSRFRDNGYLGVHAHRATTLVVEDSIITGNNKSGFDNRHSSGGLKITTSTGVTVRNNDVSRNGGPGIWTDLSTDSITISYNRVERNVRAGIELELSSNINVVSNVVLNNGEAGVWVLESQHVHVAHNTTSGNVREVHVLEGPRRRVDDVSIFNNVLGNSRGGSALVEVEDWTRVRSADQMGVQLDSNAYWLPPFSPVDAISEWGGGQAPNSLSHTLVEHTAATGGDGDAITSTMRRNPYWSDAAAGDYRAPASLATGSTVIGWLAEELGVPSGSQLRPGPAAVTRQR